MKKLTILTIGLVIISILSAGCLSSTTGTTNPATPTVAKVTVTDRSNRTVVIPATIDKIAVLTSPLVQDMYVLGEQDKLSAIASETQKSWLLRKIDPRIANMSTPLAMAGNINTEELLKANPDVCIGSSGDMAAVRKNTGIPTLEVPGISMLEVPGDDASFETIKDEVGYFGRLFGKEEKANAYNVYQGKKLALVASRVIPIPDDKRKKIYLGFGPDHLSTYGGDTFMQEWIDMGGSINVAEDLSTPVGSDGGLQAVSMEQVLAWDPDIIIVDSGKRQDLYTTPPWNNISAVKHHRIFPMPEGMFRWDRPSAESAVLMPEWLAYVVYPVELKSTGTTIQDEVKQFYREIYGYYLSDEDVKRIMNPQTL